MNATQPIPVANASGSVSALPQPLQLNRSAFTYLWSILKRRRWMIIGVTLAVALLAIVVTLLMTPQYMASTTIEIQRENKSLVPLQGGEAAAQASTIDTEFYQTQYGLLRSRSLADRVASALRLYDNAEFFIAYGTGPQKKWFEGGRLVANSSRREQRIRAAGSILLKRIDVDPGRMSRLVDIKILTYDPQLSQKIVDQWAKDFIQETLARRYDSSTYARRFLENRLNQLRERIDQSERQLVGYAAQQGIINIPTISNDGGSGTSTSERSLAADDLATLNRALTQATADRIEAQSKLTGNAGVAVESVQNLSIGRLREQRAALAGEYAKLMTQFKPDYPPALNLQSQIAQIDRSIAGEEGRVRASLRQAYESARGREAALQAQVNGLKGGLLDLRRRSIQYNIIQREVDTNRQLYDALLQRYKEIGVAGGVGVNNISIVDEAELPNRPSSPNLLLNILAGLLVGMALSAAIALALEQIDEVVVDPSEVQREFGIALLGSIPKTSGGTPVEQLHDPKSMLSEAYLSLRTNLAFSTDHGVPRSIAITSSRPGEGKSTTSYALARLLARAGRRVILVDADMRSPSIHHILNIPNGAGVSNALSGQDALEALIVPSGDERLDALTAGVQPPNAAELLTSRRFEEMLATLMAQYDHIVVDAPPVMGLADAPLICSKVEGVGFVIEAGSTRRSAARTAIARLRSTNAHLLGLVLTKFSIKHSSDYTYAYSYGAKTDAV